jgi:hypothetical protein
LGVKICFTRKYGRGGEITPAFPAFSHQTLQYPTRQGYIFLMNTPKPIKDVPKTDKKSPKKKDASSKRDPMLEGGHHRTVMTHVDGR